MVKRLNFYLDLTNIGESLFCEYCGTPVKKTGFREVKTNHESHVISHLTSDPTGSRPCPAVYRMDMWPIRTYYG